MQTFKTKYNLSSPVKEGQRGLTYRDNLIKSQKLGANSICFRFQLDFFTLMGDFMPIFEVQEGEDKSRRILYKVKDPLSNINVLQFTSFVDKVVEMREVGNRDWHWPSLR